MSQLTLFAPGSGGIEQPSLDARLRSRTDDPPTSKAAAERHVATRSEDSSFAHFLRLLRTHGPLTCQEAGAMLQTRLGPTSWATEFDKRVKAWRIAGHVETTGEVRNGSRVWGVR